MVNARKSITCRLQRGREPARASRRVCAHSVMSAPAVCTHDELQYCRDSHDCMQTCTSRFTPWRGATCRAPSRSSCRVSAVCKRLAEQQTLQMPDQGCACLTEELHELLTAVAPTRGALIPVARIRAGLCSVSGELTRPWRPEWAGRRLGAATSSQLWADAPRKCGFRWLTR
jgi:hypothetical protein